MTTHRSLHRSAHPADVTGSDVLWAADLCRVFLSRMVGRDWSAQVPGMGGSVAKVVAHAAEGPLWYAMDLWGGPGDDGAATVTVDAQASSAAIVQSLLTSAHVCAASVDAAPQDTLGFHPAGSPDPSGFAAMACDELLVHTRDAARALGEEFLAEGELAARVLSRLFPWHEPDGDPWRHLLWANGRIELPGQPGQQGWQWHCAPLAEWNGSPPSLG